MTKQTNSNAALKAQDTIAAIIEQHPCPACGAVEVLRDADIPGATCDCGRKEGCQTRWELADIWYDMTADECAAAEAAEVSLTTAREVKRLKK